MLQFSDGMKIDTSGEYRAIKKSDGWYVVGYGMCSPESSEVEARQYAKELQDRAKKG